MPTNWKYDLGAELYKLYFFKCFKSYFVLSTNCCLLADSIVGQRNGRIRCAGSDRTYQDYLEYELEV